jgi:hypothetical protein
MPSLFAFFGLWETTLAVGAGAVSVPIIIHLLNRKRFKIVIWAAMRFLLAAQRQNTRKMRLEQLVLLAVRTLLVMLIVLAMASVMPWAENVWGYFFPEAAGFTTARSGRTFKIIVLDGSLSMSAPDGEGKTRFDKARQLAAHLVRGSPSGDGFSVLLLKDSSTWIVAEPSQDAKKVATEIDEITPAHGNAAVPAALNMIAAKLGETAGRFSGREVYFFTDLQRATWMTAPAPEAKKGAKEGREKSILQEIQKRARTVFVDVGRDKTDNLAVADLTLGEPFVTTGALTRFSATIQNFGQKDSPPVRIELWAGRAREKAEDPPLTLRPVGQDLRNIKAGDRAAVNFVHRFSSPGTYAVQVRIESEDLELDNVRTVIVTVKETISVLLVNGKPAPDRYDKATEYLRLALNPFTPGAEPKYAPLRPRVVSQALFADLTEADLASYDCIFLCDVSQFGTGELRRLQSHVRRGGGLVFSLGDRAADNLEVYNRLLHKNDQGLLPAKLEKKVTAPTEHYFTLHATEEAYSEPPLKAFGDADDRTSLRSPRFRQFIQAKPASDSRARTILSFTPELEALSKATFDKTLPVDAPAVLEWNPPAPRSQRADKGPEPGKAAPARYRGKVILVATTLNMDWHTWPGSPSFGAMMQELARLGVAGRLREHAVVVNQALEEYLLTGGAEVDVSLYFPPGAKVALKKSRTQLVEDVNVFRWAETDLSGIYRMTAASGGQEHLFAVNVPSTTPDQRGSESDLTKIDPAALKDSLPGLDFQVVTDPREVRTLPGQPEEETEIVKGKLGPVIAHYLLLAVLVLLFLEVVLAHVFGHYTAVPSGFTEPPKTGRALPGLVAMVFGVIFLLGAVVLVHAAQTGDFLGFLPDAFRGWIESLFGVPPPAPGEGTRWNLEFMPYLRDAASDPWLAGGIALAAALLLYFVYQAEGILATPAYRALLGGLRLFLILVTLAVLLPQLQLRFDRQGWPDVVLIVDDSRSMGEPDHFQDEGVRATVARLGERIRRVQQERLPEKVKAVEAEIANQEALLGTGGDEALRLEGEALRSKLQNLQNQLAQINSPTWRPTRLQLAQALVAQEENDWLRYLVHQRKTKVHIFHLDANGRAVRLTDSQGEAGEITEAQDRMIDRAHRALADLEPVGNESRLGTALRQVLDYYRGSSLSAVVIMTDGVTTRDETIGQASDYAAQKGVPLFFVGIGDDHQTRDLKLHDLQVEDTVYVNDRVIFEARLSGHGYKDLKVPVILKVFDPKTKKEKELDRQSVKVNPSGKPERVRLSHQPKEPGRKLFIIEVEPPKSDRPEKNPPLTQTRLERTIDVLETKLIKILYVEGTARYEYRFLKTLLERETPDAKKNKTVELKVVLLDADADFPAQDKSALADFPNTKAELDQFDVVILGDCDPKHAKLGDARLRMLADFVRGEDAKGNKAAKTGGGLLMIAGPNYAPHAYKNTPLADVLPIEPVAKPADEPEERMEKFQLELTPLGRSHNIFRLTPDEGESMAIWQKLAPLFWWSEGYRLKPLAEVLAVHPRRKADFRDAGQDSRHPLVVQQPFVGSGRSMFFGFEESWRWRFRDQEPWFNKFWIQTVRFLSRSRLNRTTLRLDRQTPYRLGEPIKVTVKFPDASTVKGGAGPKVGPKSEVTVIVEYRPKDRPDAKAEPEIQTMQLDAAGGLTFEGMWRRTQEGKYRFWLSAPDVSKEDPTGQKPSAEAVVELPPGELDRLRMNREELKQAADATEGGFYSLASAEQLLDDLPAGIRVSLATPKPPWLLWNHFLIFLLVLFALTAEWILRKRKHLL